MTVNQSDNYYGPPPLGGGRTLVNILPSAARSANVNTASQDAAAANTLSLFWDVTAVSGTTPTLTLEVQWSHDGTTWFSVGGGVGADATSTITATGKGVRQFAVKGPYFRVSAFIAGTTPSFTFALHTYLQD